MLRVRSCNAHTQMTTMTIRQPFSSAFSRRGSDTPEGKNVEPSRMDFNLLPISHRLLFSTSNFSSSFSLLRHSNLSITYIPVYPSEPIPLFASLFLYHSQWRRKNLQEKLTHLSDDKEMFEWKIRYSPVVFWIGIKVTVDLYFEIRRVQTR